MYNVGSEVEKEQELERVCFDADKRVDRIGAFFVTTGLVLIVFVVCQGEVAPRQWATPCTC